MRMALRAVLLSLALVAYGAVPATNARVSEVESETQQEANPSTVAYCEFRRGARQGSFREVVLSRAFAAHVPAPSALTVRLLDASPHLPSGLTVPLRC
jgi:hypothetical protein